ncbi:MAG: Os1348 family NHLP clan protein [Planctomycetaceae bacterium]|nr:Os1348 family NHLP clan protein [Planctomycetaceae bacterium]
MSLTFPRGIEVLLKKAAIDPEFREFLLSEPEAAAKSIALELAPIEQAMLKTMPAEQLAVIINQTEVPQQQRRAFLGTAAAAMLAVLTGAQLARAGGPPPTDPKQKGGYSGFGGGYGGVRADIPQGSYGSGGIRPGGVDDVIVSLVPEKSKREYPVDIRVVDLVSKALRVKQDKIKPGTRITLNDSQLLELRKTIYTEFDVRMPVKTLKSLKTVKMLTEHLIASLEGYDDKIAKETNLGEKPPIVNSLGGYGSGSFSSRPDLPQE